MSSDNNGNNNHQEKGNTMIEFNEYKSADYWQQVRNNESRDFCEFTDDELSGALSAITFGLVGLFVVVALAIFF